MEDTQSERGDKAAGKPHIDMSAGMTRHSRGPDRRQDGGGLFTYQGPDRRSGRDRRTPG